MNIPTVTHYDLEEDTREWLLPFAFYVRSVYLTSPRVMISKVFFFIREDEKRKYIFLSYLKGLQCHGCLVHFVNIANYASLCAYKT